MKRIIADPIKCMACRACEVACALAHADSDDLVEAIFHRSASPRIYIEPAQGLAVPLQCRHCEDAPCIRVCPSGALLRHSQSGPVLVDQEKCIGCSFCVQACPFGVIRLVGQQSVVTKCDLCVTRQAKGLEPACVASCPVGALSLEEMSQFAKRSRARTAQAAAAGAAAD